MGFKNNNTESPFEMADPYEANTIYINKRL